MMNNTLLIVDDDAPLLARLGRAMEKRGYAVTLAASKNEAEQKLAMQRFDYAVFDLKIGQDNGLALVQNVRELSPNARIIMLTGYGNIASAVAAVKAGAIDYLAKPADADAIDAALQGNMEQSNLPSPPDLPMTADRVRWEHILRVYEQCERNISETARRLRMHRRTLQRILQKHAPHE